MTEEKGGESFRGTVDRFMHETYRIFHRAEDAHVSACQLADCNKVKAITSHPNNQLRRSIIWQSAVILVRWS
jgi:hypothetical protein